MAEAAGRRILVVEDERVIAELLVDVLGRSGHHVTVAHEVGEALDRLQESSFDLCITDFLLPDRTGLDLARTLREQGSTMRLLLVTAYLEPDLEREVGKEPSILGVVRKPMDIFELRRTVDALTC